jgi:hypothetical protein
VDNRRKAYTAIGWFFVAYALWEYAVMPAIEPYLVMNYVNNNLVTTPIPFVQAQLMNLHAATRIVSFILRDCRPVAVALLAWLVRADYADWLKQKAAELNVAKAAA